MAHKVINFLLSACLIGAVMTTPVWAGNEDYIAALESEAVEAMKEVWNIEEGMLTENASLELLEEAKDKIEYLPPKNEHKVNLEIIAEAAEAELTKPKMHLYGNCIITHYCNGACCCGQWAGGNTASGVSPTAWHTVAHNYLPFGTRVLIEGVEYVVEDRGDDNMANGDWFDIYVNSHSDAYRHCMYRTEVYIIDE